MSALRNLTPTNHPYLFGGGISGALIAGTLVCFTLMTSLVSQAPLPGAASTILPSRPRVLTVNGGAATATTPEGSSAAQGTGLAGSTPALASGPPAPALVAGTSGAVFAAPPGRPTGRPNTARSPSPDRPGQGPPQDDRPGRRLGSLSPGALIAGTDNGTSAPSFLTPAATGAAAAQPDPPDDPADGTPTPPSTDPPPATDPPPVAAQPGPTEDPAATDPTPPPADPPPATDPPPVAQQPDPSLPEATAPDPTEDPAATDPTPPPADPPPPADQPPVAEQPDPAVVPVVPPDQSTPTDPVDQPGEQPSPPDGQ